MGYRSLLGGGLASERYLPTVGSAIRDFEGNSVRAAQPTVEPAYNGGGKSPILFRYEEVFHYKSDVSHTNNPCRTCNFLSLS